MLEWLRRYCLSFPYATETIQWGEHLVFKVGGKVFAIAALEPSRNVLTIKCAPEKFADCVESRPHPIWHARNGFPLRAKIR